VIFHGSDGPHWGGTLVIDQLVTLTQPLLVPANFTLAGVGAFGHGVIVVPDDLGGPALTLASGGNSVLRDLVISSDNGALNASKPIGVFIEGAGPWYIDGVRLFGLSSGLQARNATSIIISNCSFDNNVINIDLLDRCKHCRIRDSDIRFAWVTGIRILGHPGVGSEDTLIHGCQFESNGRIALATVFRGAILADDCFGTFIFGNYFESNGSSPGDLANVNVGHPTALNGEATRFIGNYCSSDQPRPGELNEGQDKDGDALRKKPGYTQLHIGFNSQLDNFGQILNSFPTARVNEPTQ